MEDVEVRKNPTLSEVQSKRSRISSSFGVSNARTNIHLNADTDEILDDIEEISPPRRLVGRNKAKLTKRHGKKSTTYGGNRSEVRRTQFTWKRTNGFTT